MFIQCLVVLSRASKVAFEMVAWARVLPLPARAGLGVALKIIVPAGAHIKALDTFLEHAQINIH